MSGAWAGLGYVLGLCGGVCFAAKAARWTLVSIPIDIDPLLLRAGRSSGAIDALAAAWRRYFAVASSCSSSTCSIGLQHHVTYKPGKKRWEVTPEGKEYAVNTDTGKKHSDGKPVQQILWKESVAKPLKRLSEKLQAEMPEVVAHGLSR